MTQQLTGVSNARQNPGRLSFEQFLDWLNDETHAEWVNGEVVYKAPIGDAHSEVGGFLLSLLIAFVKRKRLGKIRYEPAIMRTGPDLPARSPDILFVADENLSHLKKTYVDGPADLVVEIISPESRGRDRGEKFYEYEQGGVREYWLIDPDRRQAEFYELGTDGIYRLVPLQDGTFHSRVLSGLFIRPEWLWQQPTPDPIPIYQELGLI